MLIVAVEIAIEEGAADQLTEALRTMEAATRDEPGCLTYAFSLDICEPTTMRITERWKSMADIEKHMKTSHMAEFVKAVGAIQPKSMDTKVYEIAKEVTLPR